ncbi:MAG: AI-2E family transporter [Clostridiales bacterium]|nr:AI-2E family transporter [Clostridiales bacterium]
MIKDNYKRYIVWGFTVFAAAALSILLFFAIFKAQGVGIAFHTFINILKPFIYGAVMAYVLNPVFKHSERLFKKLLAPRLASRRLSMLIARIVSTILTLALTFTFLVGFFYAVLPQLVNSLFGLIQKMPAYLTGLEIALRQFLEDSPQVGEIVLETYQRLVEFIQHWLSTELLPLVGTWAPLAYGGLLTVLSTVFNLFLGIIFMVYLLNDQQKFAAQGKKLLYSALPLRVANATVENIRYMHKVFGGFIHVKLLESLVVGIICFIFLKITNMPYVLLISTIIGVTNVIPFFGPFIGAIPSAMLLLFENPLLCLYFLIFILILQMVDGNIIIPRILGETIGLPSMWVLFSILLFGGLFGFVGMVVAVPVFAVIYSLISALTNRGLRRRNLPEDTESYRDLHHVEDESLTMIKNSEIK